MALIFEKIFERTLHRLLADFAREEWRGAWLEAWVFEDASARRAAEAQFAQAGISARLHCAYKPLVHFFLEELVGSFQEVAIAYPVDPAAPELRFRLEAYPLADMVGDAEIRFTAAPTGGMHAYEVALTGPDGTVAHHLVFAPNRVAEDHLGERVLSPCGWLRVSHRDGREIDEPLATDFENLFREGMQAIDAHPWGETEPFFDALHIQVSMPGRDTPLPVEEEAISLHEALHEDFYFSLNELFLKRTGRASNARDLRLGQVVPEIEAKEGPMTLRIETRPFMTEAAAWPPQTLHEATAPFSAAQVESVLAEIGGEAFGVLSRAGRNVPARYIEGSDAPIMLSGGHHPNEVSGVAGALRGASWLAEREGAHFAVSPLENPDGYALHWRLCQSQPHHMHHAARYTALGDDLEYRQSEPLYEKGIRFESHRRTQALLHVTLHGYPAHEWTRPLTGYIPRGFEMWTLPKGFLLIVRYHSGWAEPARRLLESVTAEIGRVPGLLAFTERQIRRCEIHAGPLPFERLNGFPCILTESQLHIAPMTLITEFPDETIYGEAFRLGHEAQARTVLAAYDALQGLGDLAKI